MDNWSPTALGQSFVRWAARRQGKIILGGSAAVLLLTALLVFGGTASAHKTAGPKLLHCPGCDLELPYLEHLADNLCPKCQRHRLEARAVSDGAVLPTSRGGKWLLFGFVALLVLQTILYFWLTDARSPADPAEEEKCKTRCPRCRRKFAYPASRAGAEVRCSGCKQPFVLPAA